MPYETLNGAGTANTLKSGQAPYQSWMQLTETQADTIKALEGADYATRSTPIDERFAQMVYLVNSGDNDPILSRLGPVVNLSAVTASTDGSSVDVSEYHNITIQCIGSSISDGATFEVQHSLDGSNWATYSSNTIDSNGTFEVTISNKSYLYVRTVVTNYIDGTFTSMIYAGN